MVSMDLLDDDTLLDLRRRAKATDPAAVLEEERRQRQQAAGTSPRSSAPLVWPQGQASLANTTGIPLDPGPAPGTCALCQQRPAKDACTSCGRPACAADLWVMLRLCRACASDADVARGQRGARPEGSNWLQRGRA